MSIDSLSQLREEPSQRKIPGEDTRQKILLEELESSIHVINTAIQHVVDTTKEGGDFEGIVPIDIKDAHGRSLICDLTATKAQLILAEAMLRKE